MPATQTRQSNIPSGFEWFQTPSSPRQPAVTVDAPANTPVPLSLVRLLATDESLRAELESAPLETLAKHGIRVSPEEIPASIQLPSQQELERLVIQFADDEAAFDRIKYAGFIGGL